MPGTPSFLGVCGGIGRKIMRLAWVTQENLQQKQREAKEGKGRNLEGNGGESNDLDQVCSLRA